MATIINTPPSRSADDGLGVGFIIGMLLVASLLAVLFFMYGLPMIQGAGGTQAETQNIEIQVPAATPPAASAEPAQ